MTMIKFLDYLASNFFQYNIAGLEDIELYPFKQLIKDSLASMMVAHLYIPSLDNTPKTPTTISSKVVTDLLQKEMGFQGLIFTDALNMNGLSDFYAAGEADLRAFLAGNDVLLFSKNVPGAIALIKEAIAKNKASWSDVEHHVKKILMIFTKIPRKKN